MPLLIKNYSIISNINDYILEMKETLKISDRFSLIKKLGQGTFSNKYRYEHTFRLHLRGI